MSKSLLILLGQQFSTDDEAYNFYNTYSRNRGFDVRRKRIDKSQGLLMKLFAENFVAIRRV